MKTSGRLSGTLVVLALFVSLFLFGAGAARADIQSPWVNLYAGRVYTVATTPSATPGDANVVFIGTDGATLRSTDGGLTWASALGLRTNYLAADPAAAGVVYAATSAGLQKSADYGQTWTLLNPVIKQVVLVSPFDSQVVFGDNYKSTDGGATWTAMAGLPAFGSVVSNNPYRHLKASRDPANPGTLLYMVSGPYRSIDNGQSWTLLNMSIVEDSLEIDPVDARYYYVGGCSSSFRAFPGGSATVSIVSHTHGLVVDPAAHNRVYAAGEYGTIRVSEDFGASWNAPGAGSGAGSDVPEGRMLFDADTGIIYLPSMTGLSSKNSRCLDADHDGASPSGGLCGAVDCDDASTARSPFKKENCFDGIDNNCTVSIDFEDSWCATMCIDGDGDGHYPLLCGGDDPKDADATVYPGAPEYCDDKDNDVDTIVDEGCTRYTYYRDYDADGFGDPTNTTISSFITPPSGFLTDNQDCNDSYPEINPGAPDVCGDGWDNDCDGTPDNGCPTFTYFADLDSDGFGDPNQPVVTTMTDPLAIGASIDSLDCNDQANWINPSATEECDWVDNNCDGVIDEVCSHTAMLWGDNAKGQIGDGTTTDRKTPVMLAGLSPVAVAAGNQHTLVVNNDGTVWAWGINGSGQLGDGTTTTRKAPVKVSGLSGVIAVSAGLNHSLALKADGTVWAWGGNGNGQLGDGTSTTRKTPVKVSGLSGVTAVSAGNYHNLALKNDGTVWAWGNNGSGRLGDGTATTRKTPIQVVDVISGFEFATAIAAGGDFSLAVGQDGTLWAWGDNCSGQLGDGTATARKRPVQVLGVYSAWAIAAGASHGLAITGDGVMAWGANAKGQLGDGTTTTRKTPVLIPETYNVSAIAAGGSHSLAWVWVGDAGELQAWGNNSDGQLGDGTTTTRKTPIVVPGQSDAIFFTAGGAHSITLR
jgi:alpha-tubulin suppressor-like RCC1 family protein